MEKEAVMRAVTNKKENLAFGPKFVENGKE
jgi:hypothetical protein